MIDMYYVQSQTIELADVAPQTIWAILSDPQTHHPRWDERVKSVRLEGPFADGTVQWIAFTFAPEPVRTVLMDVIHGVGYSDDVEVFGLDGRFTHRIDSNDAGGCRVSFTIWLEGEGADVSGPNVSAGFPGQLEALAAYARRL